MSLIPLRRSRRAAASPPHRAVNGDKGSQLCAPIVRRLVFSWRTATPEARDSRVSVCLIGGRRPCDQSPLRPLTEEKVEQLGQRPGNRKQDDHHQHNKAAWRVGGEARATAGEEASHSKGAGAEEARRLRREERANRQAVLGAQRLRHDPNVGRRGQGVELARGLQGDEGVVILCCSQRGGGATLTHSPKRSTAVTEMTMAYAMGTRSSRNRGSDSIMAALDSWGAAHGEERERGGLSWKGIRRQGGAAPAHLTLHARSRAHVPQQGQGRASFATHQQGDEQQVMALDQRLDAGGVLLVCGLAALQEDLQVRRVEGKQAQRQAREDAWGAGGGARVSVLCGATPGVRGTVPVAVASCGRAGSELVTLLADAGAAGARPPDCCAAARTGEEDEEETDGDVDPELHRSRAKQLGLGQLVRLVVCGRERSGGRSKGVTGGWGRRRKTTRARERKRSTHGAR